MTTDTLVTVDILHPDSPATKKAMSVTREAARKRVSDMRLQLTRMRETFFRGVPRWSGQDLGEQLARQESRRKAMADLWYQIQFLEDTVIQGVS